MGLTSFAVGRHAAKKQARHQKPAPTRRIALAGPPNVGKSTIFNGLTGSRQHTGNWQGKTVESATGRCRYNRSLELVDLPGCCSLLSRSPEEELARDFICYERVDAVVVVCDATNPTRSLGLALQILEITPRVMLCMNLMDEAEKRGGRLSLSKLSARLGIPVIGISAHRRKDLRRLAEETDRFLPPENAYRVRYPEPQEAAVQELEALLATRSYCRLSPRYLARLLLEDEPDATLRAFLGKDFAQDTALHRLICKLQASLLQQGYPSVALQDSTAEALMRASDELSADVISLQKPAYRTLDHRLDELFTGKRSAFPLMLLLLMLVFFLTITAANLPSAALSSLFSALENGLSRIFYRIGAPPWLRGLLLEGMLRTLGWVISVMLPPMAIFFPLFALLEDAGYLPRVAYNLDRPFCRCNACGKQALTMCMGFGCNAAGVVGCRIIDSPRERLLAILTNSLVPCNGRFPALLAILSMFVVGSTAGFAGGLLSAALLSVLILLCVAMTLLTTKLLSLTVLRGAPSAFVLELPPYRRPPILRTVLHSLSDRALSLLGRAAAVAAPTGLLLWLLANIFVGDINLLQYAAQLLDPIARPLGVDGVILIAFLLGLPANEIVIPIMLMIYLSAGGLAEASGLDAMRQVLAANGWTLGTAVSVLLLFLFHSPCSTTLLTVKKETESLRWMLLSAVIPSVIGILLCILWTAIWRILV